MIPPSDTIHQSAQQHSRNTCCGAILWQTEQFYMLMVFIVTGLGNGRSVTGEQQENCGSMRSSAQHPFLLALFAVLLGIPYKM